MPSATARGDMLLERDPELEHIAACVRRARHGEGAAVWVEAAAGMGKSALLVAGGEQARHDGLRVLRARGAELEREFPFGIVRQLFEPPLADASATERATLLDGAPAVAAGLLALPGAAPSDGAPDPTFAVLHGLYWLAANLAAERPTVLVIDDAQWADAASLRFLAFLLPRLRELPLAVLIAARPVEPGPAMDLLTALAQDHATDVVRLPPLTTTAVAGLVEAMLGVAVERELAVACREATGGTPLFVLALARALADEPVVNPDRVRHVGAADLGRWVQLQVRRLGQDAARLAAAVAILERAELPQAARLVDLDEEAAATAADLLVRAGVLEHSPLAFVHPILRTSAVALIGATRRLDAHRRAARLLAEEPGCNARVPEHLLAAAPSGDAWAVERLAAAASAAMTAGAPESAAAYLRRALAEPPPPAAAGELLLALGTAELSTAGDGWPEHLDAAIAAGGATRLAAALVLATGLVFHERHAEAVDTIDRVAVGMEPGDTRLALEGMAVACAMVDAETAPRAAGRARALRAAARDPSAPRNVLAVAAYVSALANEPVAQAAELAHRAVAAPAPAGIGPPWFLHAAVALLWCDELAAAQSLLDAATDEARAEANAVLLHAVLAQRAWLGLRGNDLTAAEADARAVLEAPAPPLYRQLATGVLVGALVERGDLDAADRALDQLGEQAWTRSQTSAVLRHARGRLRLARHRPAEALEDLMEVGDIAVRTEAPSPGYLPWRSAAALASVALGDDDGARRLSEEEVELARAFGAPRALGVALRAAGVIAPGRRGEALLREAVDVLAGSGARLEHARALTDLGAQLRRANRRTEARALLRPALDAAHRAGARPLAERAETELRATGAKPRRVQLTGLESLTASERRIAELAAQGLTNREIAQTLFVTARTVEGHLTNVFRKLDVTAREQLPEALDAPAASA